MRRIQKKMQSLIFFLSIFLINNSYAASTLCKIFKIESDFDTETLKETKKCVVNENGIPEESSSECIIIHESTTTELNIKNKIENEEKINVELNNMDEEKPLTWNVKVDIDNKTKTIINIASEKISILCKNIASEEKPL
jgi:hypothetical protein